MASRIDDLRSRRVTADYDLQSSVTQAMALDAVDAAQAMIADFQVLLQTIPPAQIVAGARKHLRAIGKIMP